VIRIPMPLYRAIAARWGVQKGVVHRRHVHEDVVARIGWRRLPRPSSTFALGVGGGGGDGYERAGRCTTAVRGGRGRGRGGSWERREEETHRCDPVGFARIDDDDERTRRTPSWNGEGSVRKRTKALHIY
jgi:hypothetical protein